VTLYVTKKLLEIKGSPDDGHITPIGVLSLYVEDYILVGIPIAY